MEACASAHHWGREIGALGHEVRLISPAYVKPFVKRQKNDMADAEAICEAGSRVNMRLSRSKAPRNKLRPLPSRRATYWCGSDPTRERLS
jgi:transposase